MPQIKKCVTRYSSPYWCSGQISGSWPLWFPRKMWQKLSCEQICLCPQYSKLRKTGSGHAADSKMRYTIEFSILMPCANYQEPGLCGSRELSCEQICLCPQYSKSRSNRKWTCRRFKNALHATVLHTDALCQISGSWAVLAWRKMWQKLSCEQICLCPQYWKSRKTGSGHAVDSKLRYTIQLSILMLCAKYQKAGLFGSREKCDRNFLWRRRRKTTEVIPIGRLR